MTCAIRPWPAATSGPKTRRSGCSDLVLKPVERASVHQQAGRLVDDDEPPVVVQHAQRWARRADQGAASGIASRTREGADAVEHLPVAGDHQFALAQRPPARVVRQRDAGEEHRRLAFAAGDGPGERLIEQLRRCWQQRGGGE